LAYFFVVTVYMIYHRVIAADLRDHIDF